MQLKSLAVAFAILAAAPSQAAIEALLQDRHVYLNASGGGSQLNDCPNPTHAFDGTGDAAELEYCPSTTPKKMICDDTGPEVCKAWTVTSASCPGKLPVTSSSPTVTLSIDVDGDGTEEPIYGHPQACIYNMDPSDKCDVHAGTYKRGGTMSDWNASSAEDRIDRSDCWIATVGALGYGRNAAIGANCSTSPPSSEVCGYGSYDNPGYLRGAQLDANLDGDVDDSHEIDTWDENRNKKPDADESLTSYPAKFSGDADLDGVLKEASNCVADGAVLGDAFYPLMWGCGDSVEVCDASISGGETRPFIDTDANGSFDFMLTGGAREVSNFVIQDIEGRDYGGGPVTCNGNGVREKLGHFSLGGDLSSQGFIADRIYFHDNAYGNVCANEHYVAIFGDDENHGCSRDTEIRDCNFDQDNRFIINDDSDSWQATGTCQAGSNNGTSCTSNSTCTGGGYCTANICRGGSNDGNPCTSQAVCPGGICEAREGTTESGCGWYFHDNVVDIKENLGCTGQFCRKGFIRFKSVDTLQIGTRKKQFRIVNNDITVSNTTATGGAQAYWIIHHECIGTCGPRPTGLGEFWFYGNAFHFRASSATPSTFGGFSCTSDGSPDAHSFKSYFFNNTFDYASTAEGARSLGGMCGSTVGGLSVNRNNAYYRATTVNGTLADTIRFSTNLCSESGQGAGCPQNNTNGSGGTPRTGWWTVGTFGVAKSSLANYIPRSNGPLDNVGSCDPDGDGITGVDWDNNPATGPNGGQETSWVDAAGNVVDCVTRRCIGGSNNGTVCTSNGNCTGGGTCPATAVMDIGAVQNFTASACADVCGDGITCSAVGETCDDGTLTTNQCVYGDSPPLTQVCSGGPTPAACRGNADCSSPAWYGDGIVNGPETCDTTVPPGTVCPAPCSTTPPSTPICVAPGVISNANCTGCAVASGSDRHVFLDTDGDGKLNQCPNPAHNTYACAPPGTPCNTANLQRCVGGTGGSAGKLRGDKAGFLAANGCPGGAFVDVGNNETADIDADGVLESLYLTPQSCVWNMAKSNSCEIHAGTYKAAGAQCDASCGDQSGVDASGSGAAAEGTIGVCDKFDCFKASIVALGDGPNMDGTGYGTALAPGRVRGANVNGSRDTWDPNDDKNPADAVYPAIISGDSDGNGAFNVTACPSPGTCTGDAFNAVVIGCGYQGQYFCRTTPLGSSGYIRIDSDGNGSFDQNVGVFAASSKETHYLQIEDLEFTRYNGGNGAYFSGVRPRTGHITMDGGDGSTDGLVADHLYVHDNDYTLGIDNYWDDNVSNEGFTETTWADFNDQHNSGCTTPTEIRRSFLVQNNARMFDYDCDSDDDCGCETFIHDNRILVDVDPAKAGVLYRNNVEGGPVPGTGAFTRTHSTVVSYIKAIGDNPTQHRFYNNEFVIKSFGSSRGFFMDLQGFGEAQGATGGQLWLYGNIFRDDPAATIRFKRFWQSSCDVDSGSFVFKNFLNTYDILPTDNPGMEPICDDVGTTIVEKNNAYLRVTPLVCSVGGADCYTVGATCNTTGTCQVAATATSVFFENNVLSSSAANRAVWFNPGSYSSGNPGTHGGLANYVPRAGGPLFELTHNGTTVLNPCDPDRDGIAGANWYGAGNVTLWDDIAGNHVDCSAGTISYGALQPNSDGTTPNPTQLKDATLKGATVK